MNILAEDHESGAIIFVYNEDDCNPMFEITISGFRYTHSVRGIEGPAMFEWYCGVLGRQFLELHERSVREGKDEVQALFKKAISI